VVFMLQNLTREGVDVYENLLHNRKCS
jgi:hypothetical protein